MVKPLRAEDKQKRKMALIKCPKCGKEMSDRAASCPQCGMTMEEIKGEKALNDARETSQIPLSQLSTESKRVDIYIDGELFYTTELSGFIQHIKL